MEQLFYPESIAIWGLSDKPNNNPRLILENLIRWGYQGRILGINPNAASEEVAGVKLYRGVDELPIIPDLAVTLIPAKYVPQAVEDCGKKGIRRMAIPSGGFNESGEEGQQLAIKTIEAAKKHNIRFVGPNGVTIANTANGLCLPFVPSYPPLKGGVSIITQSGGLGLFLWNIMHTEQVGMAKFASIGNKLDLDEADFLSYFGRDTETRVICMYLESITNGQHLMEVADSIDKPIIIYKSNRTDAGNKAAMSHTASMSNNDDILNAAFEKHGIIRVNRFDEFISTAKAFELPPMRGNKIMVMSPAGGLAVSMADICEDVGFEFADPGQAFYKSLNDASNAGIINFSNPLDMGDIYDSAMYPKVFHKVLHNDQVDGAVYLSQWAKMPPGGTDVFTRMFNTDISQETIASVRSSGKPLGIAMFGESDTLHKMKKNISAPVFNGPEEMLIALKRQQEFYAFKADNKRSVLIASKDATSGNIRTWVNENPGITGEAALSLLEMTGIRIARSEVATTPDMAASYASIIGFPVVIKVDSPDAIHKSDAGGVLINIINEEAVKEGFDQIKNNLYQHNKNAIFNGVRVMEMAPDGHDMFIGAQRDPSFGPVIYFGFGGIYIEVFKDIKKILPPVSNIEINDKIKALKSYQILSGTRGQKPVDIDGYVDIIKKIAELMYSFPEIMELDINPVRLPEDGGNAVALDARIRIGAAEGIPTDDELKDSA